MRLGVMVAAAIVLAPAPLPVGLFEAMPRESVVQFVVKDNRGGFTGETRDLDATVVVRERSAAGYAADIEAKIDARTLRTGSSLRDGQMRGDMFLNTAEFPVITFIGSAAAERPAGRDFRGTLRGRLTIKNVTREIEVPLDVIVDNDNGYTGRAEVTLRMTDFSIPIPRFLIFVAEDPVSVRLQLRLRPRTRM